MLPPLLLFPPLLFPPLLLHDGVMASMMEVSGKKAAYSVGWTLKQSIVIQFSGLQQSLDGLVLAATHDDSNFAALTQMPVENAAHVHTAQF